MATAEVVVVGTGLMTAVGVTLAETAASVRSATARFTQTPIHDKRFEPFTLAVVPDDAIPELDDEVAKTVGPTTRMLRMLRLATAPLRAAVAGLPKHAPLPGIILALPETETKIPLDASAFLQQLGRQAHGLFDVKYSLATHVGRAGGLSAIDHAADIVANGSAPIMVAGGVDTYRDLYVLGTLDAESRVKSSGSLDGFIPGEAAAFLLLATRASADTLGMTPLFSLSRASQGFETGHLYSKEVYRGDGLANTIRMLLEGGAAKEPIADVYSSMNGESHWAKEWSVAYLRNKPAFLETFGTYHPADCYGDVGAACGPAMVALAGAGIRQGYRKPPALVYGASDRGARAAMIVTTA